VQSVVHAHVVVVLRRRTKLRRYRSCVVEIPSEFSIFKNTAAAILDFQRTETLTFDRLYGADGRPGAKISSQSVRRCGGNAFRRFCKMVAVRHLRIFKIRISNDRRGSELFCVIASDSVHAHVVVIEVFVQYFRSTATLSFLFLARGRRGTTLL